MKIDAVTIFPEYFAPAQLSLLGKAQIYKFTIFAR
jgi:tRNA (guanine37-N1)-methyltransferase